jgi:hypothetical protein
MAIPNLRVPLLFLSQKKRALSHRIYENKRVTVSLLLDLTKR